MWRFLRLFLLAYMITAVVGCAKPKAVLLPNEDDFRVSVSKTDPLSGQRAKIRVVDSQGQEITNAMTLLLAEDGEYLYSFSGAVGGEIGFFGMRPGQRYTIVASSRDYQPLVRDGVLFSEDAVTVITVTLHGYVAKPVH